VKNATGGSDNAIRGDVETSGALVLGELIEHGPQPAVGGIAVQRYSP